MEGLLSELASIESTNVAESGEIGGADSSSVLPGSNEAEKLGEMKPMEDKESRLDESDDGRKEEVETSAVAVKLPMSGGTCTLYEEAAIKDNFNPDCSWRSDIQLDESDEDSEETDSEYEDDDYESSDEESEEAAAEWLRQYYLRQRGVPPALAQLPDTIKVSVVPESFADKQAREERERLEKKLRREETLRKLAAQPAGPTVKKGKRKFGDRMELEEASRDDFGNGQDYVDFLNGKLKNVSIKVTK